MSCNNCTIDPCAQLDYWSVSCSVPYYTKEEIDEIISHLDPGGCCCPKMVVSGHKLIFTDTDDCVYVDGHKLVIGG